MDLTKLDTAKIASEGAELQLRHPVNGSLLDIKIRLLGADSEKFQQAQHDMANKRINKAVRKGRLDKDQMLSEDLQSEHIDILAGCTLAWDKVQMDATDYPCTRENAKNLYTQFPWIREQVEAFINDRANFLKN